MEAGELTLLRDALADLVSARPDDLRAALREFGWYDLLAEEPAIAVEVLFTLQGLHLTTETLLDDVLAHALDHSADAVAIPLRSLDAGSPPDAVTIDAVVARPLPPTAELISPWRTIEGTIPVRVGAADLEQTSVPGLDPHRPWTRVRGLVPAGAVTPIGDAGAWERTVAAGRRALAVELNAIGDRMLALAVEHTGSRHQFGQPLASFQAVRHKLADVRVWGEVSALAAAASWEDDDPAAAAPAKSAAVRYTATAREHVQQLLGGMGFSWEHEFHWYLRRALVLEPLFGGAGQLRTEIGASIKAAGRLPELAAL